MKTLFQYFLCLMMVASFARSQGQTVKYDATNSNLVTNPSGTLKMVSPVLTTAPTITGTLTQTSNSASALVIGPNGTTNPTFKINCSAASGVNGLLITNGASGSGISLDVISSTSNEPMFITTKGTGNLNLSGNSGGVRVLAGTGMNIQNIVDGTTIETITSTGTSMSGNVLFSADNTYNIGAVGATRPKNLYLSSSLYCDYIGVDTAIDLTGLLTANSISTGTLNGNTFTTGTYTLTGTAGKTLTFSNTLTLSGTDGTTMTFPSTSATIARTDAANTFIGASTATSWSFTTPILGTPTSGTLTNCTGLPITGITSTSSSQLRTLLSDENGTGAALFDAATSPSFTTSLTTPSTTFALANTTATTLNFAGAATALNIGASATCVLNFGGSTTASEFRYLEPSGSGTNYSAFKAVAQSANITYSLPPTVGAAGTVLTDVAGNGVLTWTSAGAGTVTVVGAGSLTSTALVTGGGSATLQTPSATATLDTSGNISTPGSIKVGSGGSVAGYAQLGQGTLPSVGTTALTIVAPTSVTSYTRTLEGAVNSTGFYLGTVSGTNVTDTKVASTGTNNVVRDTTPTINTPVIAGGLTASGSGANTFAGSTGTFLTSTGANTLSGSVTVNDATTPSITLASGKTNTGFLLINGKTSGGLKIIAADASAQTVTLSLAAQTSGAATLTIPDQAGANNSVMTSATGQPLDSDLTTVAGLTATTDNFLQSKSSAWASRTVAQVQADLEGDGSLTAGVGFRIIPQNSQSAAYTTVMADSGKHIFHPASDTTARNFTIDSNANVAYPIGTAITFVNETLGGVITIKITSDTLLHSADGTTGDYTLAASKIATALKITTTKWIISP